jgi:hypothetical protein
LSGRSARERLEAAVFSAEGDGSTDGPVVGVGWATVERERALGELATELGIAPAAFLEAPSSAALGARCLVARGALGGGLAVVILEPSTEGRLAGRLARHDEGPAVIWHGATNTTHAGDPRAPSTPGPFGPERPLASIPRRPDLLRFVVDLPPGTIQP